nr:ankyrin repeat-containing protein bda1 [Quercus suber]
MDVRVERLKQVAQSGYIGAFYSLIQEEVKLLEHIDVLPFVETPLHIAGSTGHIPFAWKLNQDGFSPIHLVLQNRHIELAVSHLLAWGSEFVSINRTNLEGKTAWDILLLIREPMIRLSAIQQ